MGLATASYRAGVRLHQAREDRKVGSWLSQGVSKVRPATPRSLCLSARRPAVLAQGPAGGQARGPVM